MSSRTFFCSRTSMCSATLGHPDQRDLLLPKERLQKTGCLCGKLVSGILPLRLKAPAFVATLLAMTEES